MEGVYVQIYTCIKFLFQGKYRLRKLRRLEENMEKFEQQYPKWQKTIKQ